MVMAKFGSSVVILLCFSLHLLLPENNLVEGLYILQAQLIDYDNPNQLSFHCNQSEFCQVDCCDGRQDCISGNRRCDTFFTFCLRPLGTTGFGCGSPSSGSEIQSEVNQNDAAIDFSQSMFLGLSNPIVIPGLTNDWNGVQLYIDVRDKDVADVSQLISGFFFDHTLPVNSNSSSRHATSQGTMVMIDVSIRVLCAQNFQGSDCTKCIPGFTGAMCDENIDDCLGKTCSGNGQCIDGLNSFTCSCNPGFAGVECQDIDHCSPDPCSENGHCMDGVDSFTCNCVTGYTGTQCDSDIDECLSNPCGMNGQCENQEGSFNCSCNPGFTGDLCQIDIDDCVGVNCSGNAVCVDGVNSFMCQVVEFRGSKQLIPIVGGAIGGGVLVIIIVLVLFIVIIVAIKYKTRHEIKPDAMDIEMKENEVYGVSMTTLQATRQQPQMPDDALMSRNVCYATTQHMEIVDNECYGCVLEI